MLGASGRRVNAPSVAVYDVRGRLVRSLVAGMQPAGRFEVRWDQRGTGRAAVAAGVYFVRLHTGQHDQVRRLVVAR